MFLQIVVYVLSYCRPCLVSAKRDASPKPEPKEEGIVPSLQKPLEDKSVTEGSPLKLESKIIAKPQPHFTWTKNDKLVKESNRVKVTSQSDVNMHVATLEIPKITVEDWGEYKLVAKNTEGEVTSKAKVTVGQYVKNLFLQIKQKYVNHMH